MLELRNIVKDYSMDNSSVRALKNITVGFRPCEFVSILGPSGCGKTTLLNIIGGLDRYTSGDLIINGISTKDFTDEYWDAYRNSEIGFVFQSYNLIPHLSVLANVELALKLSGYSKSECASKAKEALKRVHMEEHIHKKPNQLSGGQMQRVSIARALVNDPRIILADEPTGALDSELGEQIMEVLKEVSSDRLVIMVTHNEELAQKYSTRIISVKDGTLIGDTDPCELSPEHDEKPRNNKKKLRLPKLGKKKDAPFRPTHMKWKTAMGISGKNLISKKRRTTLTSIAGSIGIIGMGLVLALSNGIDLFMSSMKSTLLASVPIGIYEYSMDYDVMTDLFETFSTSSGVSGDFPEEKELYLKEGTTNESMIADIVSELLGSITFNEITPEFVEYLEQLDPSTYVAMHKYYDTTMNLISRSSTEEGYEYKDVTPAYTATNFATMAGNVLSSSAMESKYWNQLISTEYMNTYYDVLYGKYPTQKDEIVLIVNENNEVDPAAFQALGFSYEDLIVYKDKDGIEAETISFDKILNYELKLVYNDYFYQKKTESDDTSWVKKATESDELGLLYNEGNNGLTLKVVGVLRVKSTAPVSMVQCNFCYTPELGEHIMQNAAKSQIALDQKKLVASGSEKTVFGERMPEDVEGAGNPLQLLTLFSKGKDLAAFNRSIGADSTPLYINIFAETYEGKETITAYLDAWNNRNEIVLPSGEKITFTVNNNSMTVMNGTESANGVFGKNDNECSVKLNGMTFVYNKETRAYSGTDANGVAFSGEAKVKVKYFDVSEMFIYNVETITNIATMALLLVASISLIVSTIMIAIITGNSVTERTREIGILRSIGAKKTDILNVFIAETVIIGALSGLIGIGMTYAVTPGLSAIIKTYTGFGGIAVVNPWATVGLLCLSVVLAVISGFIPSLIAARKNVVDALRSE